MLRGFFDVGEGQIAVGNVLDPVEAGRRVLDVRGVRQRRLALVGEGEDAFRQGVLLVRT